MLPVELSPRWQAQQIGSAYVTQCANEATAGSGALTLERLQLGKELAPLESVVMMLAPQWAAWQLRWRNTCRDLVHANEFHRVLQRKERGRARREERGGFRCVFILWGQKRKSVISVEVLSVSAM